MVYGLGERLRRLRLERNLSQKDVADALNVSAAVISNYENGGRTPSVEMLLALAGLYRCSADYLLGLGGRSPETFVDVSMLTPEQAGLLRAFLASLSG